MTVYRKARPEDRQRYIDFANMVFSMAHRPHDFKTLLPKVYGDGRATDGMQNIAVDEAGQIRGLVAVMPGEMQVLGQTLHTGYVGTVSVHPYARGEGHMKALMEMALDEARANGVDLLMLGGQRQRYEYFGFARGGVAQHYQVGTANLRHALRDVDASAYEFLPMRGAEEAFVDQACALHAAQPVHMRRARNDFLCILESWYAKPFVVLKGGAFAGYLLASQDMSCVNEFRLVDPEQYGAVLKGWMQTNALESVQIGAAAYDIRLNQALMAFAESWWMEMAQQVCVLNFAPVLEAFLRLNASVRPLAEGEMSLWIDGAPYTARVQRGELSVEEAAPEDAPHLTAMQAQEMLFSPLAGYSGALAPAGWLPLPLFMHSADEF